MSPIGLDYLNDSNAEAASIASASSRLRGRVFQVGELAGSAADSANKVLTGVVDSSWTALRGLISSPNPDNPEELASAPETSEVVRPNMRPRQASAFSLASVTASVATIAAAATSRSRSRANSRVSAVTQPREEKTWKGNEEMMEVSSKPGSIRERDAPDHYPSSDVDEANPEDEMGEVEGKAVRHHRRRSDTRSIGSVSSALSRNRSLEPEEGKERASISNRLASIGVLGRLSNPADTTSGASNAGAPQTSAPGSTDGPGKVSVDKQSALGSAIADVHAGLLGQSCVEVGHGTRPRQKTFVA